MNSRKKQTKPSIHVWVKWILLKVVWTNLSNFYSTWAKVALLGLFRLLTLIFQRSISHTGQIQTVRVWMTVANRSTSRITRLQNHLITKSPLKMDLLTNSFEVRQSVRIGDFGAGNGLLKLIDFHFFPLQTRHSLFHARQKTRFWTVYHALYCLK